MMKGLHKKQAGIIALTASLSVLGCRETSLTGLSQDSLPIQSSVFSIAVENYCVRSGYQFSDFWARAMSYEIESGKMLTDFDRDGLPDVRDKNEDLGITRVDADSNGDGYGDLLIYQGGFDLDSQKSLRFCADTLADYDIDGLTDCEEDSITHTSSLRWDSDRDQIPDSLEVRVGLNPLDAEDASQNLAGDGIDNIQKIKMNLPINENVDADMEALGLQYTVSPLKTTDGSSCYDLKVSNISKVDVANGNLVNLYIFEKKSPGIFGMRKIPAVLEDMKKNAFGDYVVNYEAGDDYLWSDQ